MIERSKRVDPYWRAMLNNIKRQSVFKGNLNLLTKKEYVLLMGKMHYNPMTGKMRIPANKREAAWKNILAAR